LVVLNFEVNTKAYFGNIWGKIGDTYIKARELVVPKSGTLICECTFAKEDTLTLMCKIVYNHSEI
jgi:hypothetical protein